MLYRGSEVVREVAWVIYDEVHYMRDKERGVVWEESIILLPHKVRFVFLSATIPNAPDFVDWVSKIHHQPCHVVYTDYRPVPLQHYVFPSGGEGLYLVVDEKGKFREENFQRAMSSMQSTPSGHAISETAQQGGGGGGGNDKKSRKMMNRNMSSDLLKIIKLIMDRGLDPCIIFSFSKKDCETYALQMSRMDFNTEEEKLLIEQVFINAMESLSEDDKTLPQIVTILPLLKRGVGIHHGGLLPILKEVIEILFQEGLIKCLFATETFSIGINMPAKTVVFTNTRKFDGKDFRFITSGEYIQMSGRAGRRGKDDKGIVIQMLEDKMEPDVTKNMIYGASDPLYSSYQIKYNMVLNMMRVEGADPQNIIRSSFHQFQQQANAPKLTLQAIELEKEANLISIPNEEIITEFLELTALHNEIKREVNSIIMEPIHCLPFLQSGRLIHVSFYDTDFGWGTILNLKKADFTPASTGKKQGRQPQIEASKFIGTLGPKDIPMCEYYLEALLEVKVGPTVQNFEYGASEVNASDFNAVPPENEVILVYIALEAVDALSAVRLNIPKDVNKESSRIGVRKCIREVQRRFSTQVDGIPLLHPIKDIGIAAEKVETLIERKEELTSRLQSDRFASINMNATSTASKSAAMQAYHAKQKLLSEAQELHTQANELQSVTMKEELKKMRKVLKRLEYVTTDGVLTSKGRFACELSAGDELVITNMIFSGVFNELTVEQTVAVLSCFEHQEQGKDGPTTRFRNDMQRPMRLLQAVAKEVAAVLLENRLIAEEDEFVNKFDAALVDVAYAWASGVRFSEVCKMTEIYEGSIIRSLRRLEELLRQLAAASLAIGNAELVAQFQEGAKRIRRGVVFAASLYI